MQRYSDEDLADAVRVQWLADAAAGNHWPERDQAGPLTVPPQFTAWLLMSRAHMPLELIAEVCGVEPRRVTRGAYVAWWAMLVWPPYAERFDEMLDAIPRYTGGRGVPSSLPKEAACVVRG